MCGMISIDPSSPVSTLESIRSAMKENIEIVEMSGLFSLTKTGPQRLFFRVKREFEVEKKALNQIEQKVDWATLIRRFNDFHPGINTAENYYPDTFAISLQACSDLSVTKHNVFLPFPLVLGSVQAAEHCTLEFVDKWKEVFTQCITPAVEKCLTSSCLKRYLQLTGNIEVTTYGFSLLHELSHRYGAFRVLPAPQNNIKLEKFQIDLLSELQANALVVKHSEKILEYQVFWLFHHIFWHARWETVSNPVSGAINIDNDSCLGAYLAELAFQNKIFEWQDNKLHVHFDKILELSSHIISELETLSDLLNKTNNTDDQKNIVWQWLQKTIPYSNLERFYFSENVQKLLGKVKNVPTSFILSNTQEIA